MSESGATPGKPRLHLPVVFDAPNDSVLAEVKQVTTEAVAFWVGTFNDYLDTLTPEEQEAAFVDYFLERFREVMSEEEEGEGEDEGERGGEGGIGEGGDAAS